MGSSLGPTGLWPAGRGTRHYTISPECGPSVKRSPGCYKLAFTRSNGLARVEESGAAVVGPAVVARGSEEQGARRRGDGEAELVAIGWCKVLDALDQTAGRGVEQVGSARLAGLFARCADQEEVARDGDGVPEQLPRAGGRRVERERRG